MLALWRGKGQNGGGKNHSLFVFCGLTSGCLYYDVEKDRTVEVRTAHCSLLARLHQFCSNLPGLPGSVGLISLTAKFMTSFKKLYPVSCGAFWKRVHNKYKTGLFWRGINDTHFFGRKKVKKKKRKGEYNLVYIVEYTAPALLKYVLSKWYLQTNTDVKKN